VMMAVMPAAMIGGPLAGGFITDNWTWRWAFYVNLPVGAVALAIILVAIPKRAQRRDHYLDIPGAALLAAGTAAFLFGVVSGPGHGWGSARVLGLLAASAILLALFALVERRAPEPILPFDLIKRPTVATGVVSIGLAAMAMVGTITFVPLFVQGVIGNSATSSGAVLMPFMLGAVITSAVSGQWVSRSGRYRPPALVGPIVLGTGLFLLSRMNTSTTTTEAGSYMVVSGIGLGLMMQNLIVAVQNVVPMRAMGSATALTQFSRSIGATLGVTLMGVLVNHGLPPGIDVESQAVRRLPPALRVDLADAMQPAFMAASGLCAVIFLIVFLGLKEVPLRKGVEEEPPAAIPEAQAPTVVRSET
jgi:MFS family permease